MSRALKKPVFVTFTGVDRVELIPGMMELSAEYPIEWGILLDPAQEDNILFPAQNERTELLSSPLRFAAHVCGKPAQAIANGGRPEVDLRGFARLQLNHSRQGSSEAAIANAYSYCLGQGLRLALQCQGEFPADTRADWLFDVSFGAGARVTAWPVVHRSHPFCGFSGGLSPTTIGEALSKFRAAVDYWIDMESGVRTDGLLDLGKCAQVCKLIYG